MAGVAASLKKGKYPIIGTVYHIDALRTLNRALVETAAEEHG